MQMEQRIARVLVFGVAIFVGTVMLYAQSWTTPWTATTGVVVTAAQLNQTRDNLTVLRAGGLAISGQVADRVPFAASATQLETDGDLTFDGTTLTTGNIIATGTFRVDNGATIGDATSDAHTVNGYINSASGQPGFLAYNSAGTDACGTACTVEADTEAYDTTGAFNNTTDTFTAGVGGTYLFCAGVQVNDTLASPPNQTTVSFVTTAGTYQFGHADLGSGESAGMSGCVMVALSASNTAFVRVNSGGATVTGNGSSRMTYFSGRLMP
jgi:hypothetical protein